MGMTKEAWIKRKENGNGIPWNKGIKVPQQSGENHPLWKGENVSYAALHHWVKRQLGKPTKCDHCGAVERLEWASISHHAQRDINDYMPLCIDCHRQYDHRTDTKRGQKAKLRSTYFNRWANQWQPKA